jgi:hypothetical protein
MEMTGKVLPRLILESVYKHKPSTAHHISCTYMVSKLVSPLGVIESGFRGMKGSTVDQRGINLCSILSYCDEGG